MKSSKLTKICDKPVVQEEKKIVRKKILNLLRNQEEEARRTKSLIILDKLIELPEFKTATTILFYASFDGEVETFELMKKAQKLGKKIVLPLINRNETEIIPVLVNNLEEDLEYGQYGIKQPKSNLSKNAEFNQLDLVIVPAVAFDKQNNRLGRGAGYYDRFLKKISPDIPFIGIAFDFQIVDQLPRHTEDIPVSLVITS